MSAQKAATQIGHLQLIWSSRTVYLNTRQKEERFKVLLPRQKRDHCQTTIPTYFVQGITWEKIVLGLSKNIFAEGQSYVALSRVKSLGGLAIESFDP